MKTIKEIEKIGFFEEIENKTVLWWGGRGHSAEDTAYQNLKAGIEAPMSGSIETNGIVVAEYICMLNESFSTASHLL